MLENNQILALSLIGVVYSESFQIYRNSEGNRMFYNAIIGAFIMTISLSDKGSCVDWKIR